MVVDGVHPVVGHPGGFGGRLDDPKVAVGHFCPVLLLLRR
jgi:hypothetical protein